MLALKQKYESCAKALKLENDAYVNALRSTWLSGLDDLPAAATIPSLRKQNRRLEDADLWARREKFYGVIRAVLTLFPPYCGVPQ